MGNVWKFALGSIVLLAGVIVFLIITAPPDAQPSFCGTGPSHIRGPLLVYCAAGMKKPVEEIVRRWEAETGVHVEVQYGGSGTLLSNLKIARVGDVFIAADAGYMALARADRLVEGIQTAAILRPVIATAKGNPLGVRSLKDLASPRVRTVLANPEAASIGKTSQAMFKKFGLTDLMDAAIRERGVLKPTVNDVANDIKLGAMDAGIIWDGVAAQYPELEAIPIEGSEKFCSSVTVAPLNFSKNLEAANAFAGYVADPARAGRVFAAHGFKLPPP